MRIRDAADLIGVSYATLWKWVQRGSIKAIQPGGSGGIWFISPEELHGFLGAMQTTERSSDEEDKEISTEPTSKN